MAARQFPNLTNYVTDSCRGEIRRVGTTLSLSPPSYVALPHHPSLRCPSSMQLKSQINLIRPRHILSSELASHQGRIEGEHSLPPDARLINSWVASPLKHQAFFPYMTNFNPCPDVDCIASSITFIHSSFIYKAESKGHLCSSERQSTIRSSLEGNHLLSTLISISLRT